MAHALNRHPKARIRGQAYPDEIVDQPFASEEAMAADAGRTLTATHARAGYGGGAILRDQTDNPVRQRSPFKNLRSE